MSDWIDFKELRSRLDFASVLQSYGVQVKPKGDQHHGFCPLPSHQGKRNSPSFSANLKKGIFQCFGCGAKGNVLEFAALMESVRPEDGAALRSVALKLQTRFGLGGRNQNSICAVERGSRKQDLAASTTAPSILNAPLDFELKELEAEHPYLLGRGFLPATIRTFGLGYCSRGLLKNRVAIPLKDQKARLIGYAGRITDETTITDAEPKYRFPSARERNGKLFEFRKTRFVYNGFRITTPQKKLIVVEGFASVWWLHQHGFRAVIATMGADCSARQAEIIASLTDTDGVVWVISDGDAAGERHRHAVFDAVAQCRSVRNLKLEQGKQPTDYPGDFFREKMER